MVHPFSIVSGFFDDPLQSWQGQFGASINSHQFYETDPSRGHARGAMWSLAPTGAPMAHALPMRIGDQVWGAEHHRRFEQRFGHGASWAIFGEDLPDSSNSVSLDSDRLDRNGLPTVTVSYKHAHNSYDLMKYQVSRAVESFDAAGANDTSSASMLAYSGWHLLGTARMGADPSNSVVDSECRSHDVPNLFICDGSVFPTAGAVNPTNTVVALSIRLAEMLAIDSGRNK